MSNSLSWLSKLLHGVSDDALGAAQLGTTALVPASHALTAAFPSVPKIDHTADSLNQFMTNRETGWQQRRQDAGDTGPEYMRGVGNGIGALPLMFALPEIPQILGIKMLGELGTQALQGASVGALQPVSNGTQSYLMQKLGQIRAGAGLV